MRPGPRTPRTRPGARRAATSSTTPKATIGPGATPRPANTMRRPTTRTTRSATENPARRRVNRAPETTSRTKPRTRRPSEDAPSPLFHPWDRSATGPTVMASRADLGTLPKTRERPPGGRPSYCFSVRTAGSLSIRTPERTLGPRLGKRSESRLTKVRVEGKGLANAEVLHEDEGSTVRERPPFVRSSDEELPSRREGRRLDADETQVLRLQHRVAGGRGQLMALRPCDEGRHGLVEDVVAEDEAEGVRTRPPLVLEEFDGGAVVSVADVEPRHEEARVSEGVLRHLPPSVQEAVQASRIRRAGIEYEGRIVERVLGEIHRLRGEGVRKGRAVPEGEFGEGSDGRALGGAASQAALNDLRGLPNHLLLLGGEPEGRHLVCMHA